MTTKNNLVAQPDSAAPVVVSDYQTAVEVFRSRSVSADTGGELDARFRRGVLLRLDPPAHTRRRTIVNGLFRGSGQREFRDRVLDPAVARRMRELRPAADQAGSCSIDLVEFGTRANLEFAAALIGCIPPGSAFAEIEEDLLRLHRDMYELAVDAFQEASGVAINDDAQAIALAAKDQFEDRYFRPAYEHRRDLLAQADSDAGQAPDLPHDLMTLMAEAIDPMWSDYELALREATTMMRAAVHTSTQTLCNTLDLLDSWFAANPADWQRRFDREFLLASVNEALRCRPIIPNFIRRAVQDFALANGRKIAAGQLILVRTNLASTDPAVFGPDAREFNPRRSIPRGVAPYGLAFNSGPHMCFGIPLVLGDIGTDGSLVHLLREFYRHGVRLDGRTVARRISTESIDHFVTFPVTISFSGS